MKMTAFCLLTMFLLSSSYGCAQPAPPALLAGAAKNIPAQQVKPAAERMDEWLSLVQNKRVGVFANHTSMIGNTHLVDTLLKRDIKVVKIYGPEHGFRGKAGAGESVKSERDESTGIPVISLYGNRRRPTTTDLKGVDILLFDIQDVGVRFYTYISSLEELMEAAFENNIPLVVLDRPNPNGFYVDGPVLEREHRSFVGMQPIPLVYGMTIGEYALMIAGEKWLSEDASNRYASSIKNHNTFLLKVIPCINYDHTTRYELPVKPSPNLPDMQSIYLYPSTGLFEGTVLSEGRGTAKPFQYVGHPLLPKNLFSFTPKPNEGAKSSKHYHNKCYGFDLSREPVSGRVEIKYLLDAYRLFPGKDTFFLKNNFFHKLAGNSKLMQQIKSGADEKTIRASWAPDLKKFKAIRKKYLLYKDFE